MTAVMWFREDFLQAVHKDIHRFCGYLEILLKDLRLGKIITMYLNLFA